MILNSIRRRNRKRNRAAVEHFHSQPSPQVENNFKSDGKPIESTSKSGRIVTDVSSYKIPYSKADFSPCFNLPEKRDAFDPSRDISALNELLMPFDLFVNDKIDGGKFITYKVKMGIETNVNKLMRSNFEIALDCESVRVSKSGKWLNVEKPISSETIVFRDCVGKDLMKKLNAGNPELVCGLSADGKPINYNLSDAPHMLIAGTTGSGKTVFIQSLICSLLMARTDSVEIFAVDPKGTEFNVFSAHDNFNGITETRDAIDLLRRLTAEMDDRYQMFRSIGVSTIDEYNKNPRGNYKLPRTVLIVDELSDLMLSAGKKSIESMIVRLAQKARACGIHLILATQRPSKDVVTGRIKDNIPTRVSFRVTDKIASRIILERNDAEKLEGRGDMLFLANGSNDPIRGQAPLLDKNEMGRVALESMTYYDDCEK